MRDLLGGRIDMDIGLPVTTTDALFAVNVQRKASDGVAGLAAAGSFLDRQIAAILAISAMQIADQRRRQHDCQNPGSSGRNFQTFGPGPEGLGRHSLLVIFRFAFRRAGDREPSDRSLLDHAIVTIWTARNTLR